MEAVASSYMEERRRVEVERSQRHCCSAGAGNCSRLWSDSLTHSLVRSRDDGVDWMVAAGRAVANL